jgi:hypothetical protein
MKCKSCGGSDMYVGLFEVVCNRCFPPRLRPISSPESSTQKEMIMYYDREDVEGVTDEDGVLVRDFFYMYNKRTDQGDVPYVDEIYVTDYEIATEEEHKKYTSKSPEQVTVFKKGSKFRFS